MGTPIKLADFPLPESVTGPVIVKVALSVFVVTVIFPNGKITVPCKEMNVGEFGALLSILMLPENGPGPFGVKTVLKLDCPPGGILVTLGGRGPTRKKGSCVAMLEIDNVAVPGFEIVTGTEALVVPSRVGGKVICVGETLIAGWPVAVIMTW